MGLIFVLAICTLAFILILVLVGQTLVAPWSVAFQIGYRIIEDMMLLLLIALFYDRKGKERLLFFLNEIVVPSESKSPMSTTVTKVDVIIEAKKTNESNEEIELPN